MKSITLKIYWEIKKKRQNLQDEKNENFNQSERQFLNRIVTRKTVPRLNQNHCVQEKELGQLELGSKPNSCLVKKIL